MHRHAEPSHGCAASQTTQSGPQWSLVSHAVHTFVPAPLARRGACPHRRCNPHSPRSPQRTRRRPICNRHTAVHSERSHRKVCRNRCCTTTRRHNRYRSCIHGRRPVSSRARTRHRWRHRRSYRPSSGRTAGIRGWSRRSNSSPQAGIRRSRRHRDLLRRRQRCIRIRNTPGENRTRRRPDRTCPWHRRRPNGRTRRSSWPVGSGTSLRHKGPRHTRLQNSRGHSTGCASRTNRFLRCTCLARRRPQGGWRQRTRWPEACCSSRRCKDPRYKHSRRNHAGSRRAVQRSCRFRRRTFRWLRRREAGSRWRKRLRVGCCRSRPRKDGSMHPAGWHRERHLHCHRHRAGCRRSHLSPRQARRRAARKTNRRSNRRKEAR